MTVMPPTPAAEPAQPSIKGWCPGALKPMVSGDGLVVRVRARTGALPLDALDAVAELAGRLGNGHIDVTRRANLQLRGVTQATLPAVLDGLRALGLLDASPEAEAVRNIMLAPLAGLDPGAADVRGMARALEALLAEDPRLHALPGKFGVVICGGGALPVVGELADIALRVWPGAATAALGIATANGWSWLGDVAASDAAEAARAVALAFQAGRAPGPRGRMRDADPPQIARIRAAVAGFVVAATGRDAEPATAQAPRIGCIALADGAAAVGLGAPFGRLEARQLSALVCGLRQAGARDVRLSPWRTLYVGVRDHAAGGHVVAVAAAAGFITDAADPLLAVEACPGRPDCPQAHAETRALARRLAEALPGSGFEGTLHVSGCAKGCARSQPAALTLVGCGEGFRVVRRGSTSDAAIATVSAQDLADAPHRLLAFAAAPTNTESSSA